MRVLIVDDDKEIVELLSIYAQSEGYEVLKAYNGQQAVKKFEQAGDVGIILMDVMMPIMNGLQVVKHIRDYSNVPIILLTAKTDDVDKIRGLVTGADDYVTKPFNPIEVMIRIKSVTRRVSQPKMANSSDLIVLNGITINTATNEVKNNKDELIPLTASEFQVLLLLANNLGKIFTADDVYKEIWDSEDSVSGKTVMVHISHLRDKLDKATNGEKIVQTVWGKGYKIDEYTP
ncbi:MAG: response regulator transcription factor [Lactobacillales bacterium]|nr:response regulator transcription factor [Lactobacillales bacterium]